MLRILLYRAYCFCLMLMFIACDYDEVLDDIDLASRAYLESRYMAITICKDAFVTVGGDENGNGGYTSYKGTTCKTVYASGGLGAGWYEAGGFPQHGTATDTGSGGGNGNANYYIGDNWEFKFPKLEEIYGSNSTLNVKGKSDLEYALQAISTYPMEYSKIYEKLKAKNVRISFEINPNINSAAQYNATTNTISFQSSYDISWQNLSEELLHAAQYHLYYGSTMNMQYKDYEFEVKCFNDFSHWIGLMYDGLPYSAVGYYAINLDDDPDFHAKYGNFIEDIYTNGHFPRSLLSEFKELADEWNGYSGLHLTSFTPKMLLDMFGKPRQPLGQGQPIQ